MYRCVCMVFNVAKTYLDILSAHRSCQGQNVICRWWPHSIKGWKHKKVFNALLWSSCCCSSVSDLWFLFQLHQQSDLDHLWMFWGSLLNTYSLFQSDLWCWFLNGSDNLYNMIQTCHYKTTRSLKCKWLNQNLQHILVTYQFIF